MDVQNFKFGDSLEGDTYCGGYEFQVIRQTEKAVEVCYLTGMIGTKNYLWIPKSIIQIEREFDTGHSTRHFVNIPKWWFYKNNLHNRL